MMTITVSAVSTLVSMAVVVMVMIRMRIGIVAHNKKPW